MTTETKKRLGIVLVLILIIGSIFMIQRQTPFDIFLTKDHTTPTKADQIAYLKKHEQEMTEGAEKWNSNIKSIQWQWNTVDIGKIGNGTPQGGGWLLTIDGQFNEIKDSSFQIGFELKNEKSFPSINNFYQMQPFRVDGGTKLYE